jgi:hypothetical protein
MEGSDNSIVRVKINVCRWRQHVQLKRCSLLIYLHGDELTKAVIAVTAVKPYLNLFNQPANRN